ncbi:MAG: hypothetical protein VXY99_14675, partial [Pseudomonadota bacterium]|nr:hypothetical protein [Pseudomonadota bacterium]
PNHLMAALFLAAVVNIKPNAILFLFAVPLGNRNLQLIYIAKTVFFGGLILVCSLMILNFAYPDYSLVKFQQAIGWYHAVMVEADKGTISQHNASLLGFFVNSFGYYSYAVEVGSMILGLIVAVYITVLIVKKIADPILAWVGLAFTYTLASPVFADYHLVIFLTVVALAQRYMNVNKSRDDLVVGVFLSLLSLLILTPKYLFFLAPHTNAILNSIFAFIGLVVCVFAAFKQRVHT